MPLLLMRLGLRLLCKSVACGVNVREEEIQEDGKCTNIVLLWLFTCSQRIQSCHLLRSSRFYTSVAQKGYKKRGSPRGSWNKLKKPTREGMAPVIGSESDSGTVGNMEDNSMVDAVLQAARSCNLACPRMGGQPPYSIRHTPMGVRQQNGRVLYSRVLQVTSPNEEDRFKLRS